MLRKTTVATLLVLGIHAGLCGAVGAQNYLEELEKKVGGLLKKPSAPASKPQGELPAPAQSTPAPPNNAGNVLQLQGNPPTAVPTVPPPIVDSSAPAAAPGPQAYLGLEVQPVVGGGIGVRVASVAQDSPAWKAGFRDGDLIRGIDGHAIANIDGMVERLSKRMPGESVKFLVMRGDRHFELTAVLQDSAIASRIQGPLNLGAPRPGDAAVDLSGPAWLGLAVSDLSQEFRRQFGISAYRGAAVTDVVPGSPADLAQIKPGDAVVEINGRAIDSAQDVLALIAQSRPGQLLNMLVFRGQSARQRQVVLSTDPRTVPERTSRFVPSGPLQGQVDAAAPLGAGLAPTDLQKEVRAMRDELRKSREQLNNLERRLDQLLDLMAAQPAK